jgi:DUF971 family protein
MDLTGESDGPSAFDQAAYDKAGRPKAVEVRLKKAEKALEIDFADGRSFRFSAEFLRVFSPSAEVQGHWPDQRQTIAGKRAVGIRALEPVGVYALRLLFDDGHDSGLFSWEYFYNTGLKMAELWAEYLARLDALGLKRDSAE